MKKIIINLTSLVFYKIILFAQETSENQRIGNEAKTTWEFSACADTSAYAQSGATTSLFFGTVQTNLDLTLQRVWSFSVSFPVSMQYLQGESVRYPVTWNPGDLTIAAGWMGRVSNLRIQTSVLCTAPTGPSVASYPEGSVLVTGSGRWTTGLAGSCSWIIDPVVLGISLAYFIGLPKQEQYGLTWSPCTISLKASITEVLNSSLGYTVRLGQTVKAPDILNGYPNVEPWFYSAGLEANVWLGSTTTRWTLGAQQSLTNFTSPLVLTAGFTYTWRSKVSE